MQQLSMEQKANRNPRCVELPPSPDSSRAGRLRAGTEGRREHAPSGTGGRVGSVSSRTAGRTPQLGDAPGTPLPTAAQAPGLRAAAATGVRGTGRQGGAPVQGPNSRQPRADGGTGRLAALRERRREYSVLLFTDHAVNSVNDSISNLS